MIKIEETQIPTTVTTYYIGHIKLSLYCKLDKATILKCPAFYYVMHNESKEVLFKCCIHNLDGSIEASDICSEDYMGLS